MCKNFTNNWNAVKQNCQHLTIINPYCHYKIRKRNKIAHYSLYCLILMPSLSVPTLFHAKEKRMVSDSGLGKQRHSGKLTSL